MKQLLPLKSDGLVTAALLGCPTPGRWLTLLEVVGSHWVLGRGDSPVGSPLGRETPKARGSSLKAAAGRAAGQHRAGLRLEVPRPVLPVPPASPWGAGAAKGLNQPWSDAAGGEQPWDCVGLGSAGLGACGRCWGRTLGKGSLC